LNYVLNSIEKRDSGFMGVDVKKGVGRGIIYTYVYTNGQKIWFIKSVIL
jgi:hypothetical protein